MEARHSVSEQLAALREERKDDPTAWNELVPLVYDELRAIAHRQLRLERDSHTLTTTGLVNEAYLRLAQQRQTRWNDRAQFFAIAARVMRRVLLDYARQHRAAKRGGAARQVTLDDVDHAPEAGLAAGGVIGVADERAELLVMIDEALTRLGAVDQRLVEVVECRFFGGLSEDETAAALGVTARTVRRDWVKAKDWLRRALDSEQP